MPARKKPLFAVWMIVLTLGAGLFPYQAAHAEWEVKRFKIFAGAPYQRADGAMALVGHEWLETEDLFPGFDKEAVELAFNQAAEWYSSNGFPEPLLEPVVQTDEGPAYQIYVCSEASYASLWTSQFAQEFMSLFEGPHPHIDRWSNCGSSLDDNAEDGLADPNWAAYNGRCAVKHGARPVMFINSDGPTFRNGKLTAQGYNTVSHELMHAIQANTVQGKSEDPCKIGDWIGEGQADAISMDMLDKLWVEVPQPTSDGWITKHRGIRHYYKNMARDPDGYPVSSFWRFLADLHGGYDYLLSNDDGDLGVFDFEIEKPGDWKSEVMWLDTAIYARFNKRMNEVLGLFMNDFGLRIPPMSWTSGNAETDWPRWANAILTKDKCEEITLSGRKTSETFTIKLEPIASGCAFLTVNVPQATVNVSLQADSPDATLFKDVWVGLAQGNTVLTDAMMVGTSPRDVMQSVGIWANITVTSGFPNLLTFTNASDKPEYTKPREVTFEVSINNSTNNLRGEAPGGPGKAAKPAAKPSYKKHTQTLQKKQAATMAMITEQKNLDKEALSPNSAMSTSVSMNPNQRPCDEPFVYAPCGPSLGISLELMPGTWANLAQSAGSGGTGAQIFSSMMGQALSNPFDSNEVMMELSRKAKAIDGASVSIMIPYRDYGQTGSVNNAMISTEVNGIHMEAMGPPDAQGFTRLTGSVNIEEYTEFTLRGSFSAPLAYFEDVGDNQPPAYRRGPTMTGTFNHVAPWLSDDRVTQIQMQTEAEIADDIGNSLGVPAATMRALREEGSIPGGSGPGSSSGSGNSAGGSIMGGCDCSCENKDKADELCEFFCEEEFAQCPG